MSELTTDTGQAASPGTRLMHLYHDLWRANNTIESNGDILRGSLDDAVGTFINTGLNNERVQSGHITLEELAKLGKTALETYSARQVAESESMEAEHRKDTVIKSISEVCAELVGSTVHVEAIDKPGSIKPILYRSSPWNRDKWAPQASGLLARSRSYERLRLLPRGFLSSLRGSDYVVGPFFDSDGDQIVELTIEA
ncbi:MAG TPA: hypothetical protein VFH99_03005 [Candidatus Saccharimonadales bacterium]|nr:hypothetical protein [Candidatus Saccharimonadales bacterium]